MVVRSKLAVWFVLSESSDHLLNPCDVAVWTLRLEKSLNQEREWQPSSERFENGNGTRVTCDGQLGYAKDGFLWREKLASVLADVLKVAVPPVEFGQVTGWGDVRFAISRVLNENCKPLRNDDYNGHNAEGYTRQEIGALKTASGLIPFLIWIGAEDHNKDSNLVICERDDGSSFIVAIDFADAFAYICNPAHQSYHHAFSPPGLARNLDRQILEATLQMIEQLPVEEIRACCVASEVPRNIMESIIDALETRRSLVRQIIVEQGWLS